MTLFSSLGARRFALLAVMFVIAVACAKVDRGYYDEGSLAGADNGGTAGNGGGGKAGSGTAGKPTGDAGSAGEAEAGSGGENAGGAGGAGGALSDSLTVVLAGDGKGVVSSDPSGIDCGATCSADFDQDSQVVLTAKPDAKSTFTGWLGGGCSGTGKCTTTISDATKITATFASIKVTLTVALAGTGTGSVKSAPAGIECGTTCSMPVPQGSSVVLTATPEAGSVFAGWSGACSGTGDCTTTVDAATSTTATFTLTTQPLTVVRAGTGAGTVTSVPAVINCGTTCSDVVDYGTVVTLSAAVVTSTGSVFTGWSGGGCSGTGTCAVTVTAATQVTATFACSGTIPVNYSGAITTFTIPSCVTSLTIDAYGAQGGSSGTAYPGGSGARIKGTFAVVGGSSLKVLVGGKGIDATDTLQQGGGSGGGGTFVTTSANSPLVVAGGGGGAINNATGMWLAAGLGGAIGTAGLADSSGTNAGGINGLGGVTDANTGFHAGTGGGGLLGNGVGNSTGSQTSFGTPYTPGLAFVNGGAGGLPGSCAAITGCIVGRNGGFGGGGAAGFTGGGGGGYSGGGAGHLGGGGGGGSYLLSTATVQTLTAATRVGNGLVIFTY